ncbi:MAG TPA: 16S rRNA (guanine(966)-N(2))-methyltransferase RsmD [Dehalococcoidia bacterium]|nr:16S rRNA (guanine(966)-N(2))-methyltransferase RsmD [Dehalococcoidia bacterium]
MRVIAGKARGHRLHSPRSPATRPTSDLVRGAIFSSLQSQGVDLSRVLDLYAGTGALGIEALSRGAAWCDFVERNGTACALIRRNLEDTGFSGQSHVYCLTVERALEELSGPYGLVLADPPYDDASAVPLLEKVIEKALLAEDGVVVLEQGSRQASPESLGPLTLQRSQRHGDTQVLIYR